MDILLFQPIFNGADSDVDVTWKYECRQQCRVSESQRELRAVHRSVSPVVVGFK